MIGQGGMATVYRAEHILLKQERALKIMSSELINQPGFKESFLCEGQIVAALEHPNIVTIHDIGKYNNIYYMVMAYLDGGSLEDRISSQPLSLLNAIQILKQIGSALHFAHQQQLIHRDIKPANILFNSQGDAVLTDFGISKTQDTSSHLTQMGYGLIGTPRYMSPEQTGGQKLDHRSDLYSLALVFYEMLSGESVIKSDTTAAIIREHAISPSPILPNDYNFLQATFDKALAKEFSERFIDISAFVNRVVAVYKQHEKTITQVTPPPNIKANLLLFPIILLLIVGASSGLSWWFFNTQLETKNINTLRLINKITNKKSVISDIKKETTEEKKQVAKTQTTLMYVRVSPYTTLRIQPDGKKLIQIKKGSEVRVLGSVYSFDEKEWKNVKFNEYSGYIKATHLKESK